jgi:hypothetical protein
MTREDKRRSAALVQVGGVPVLGVQRIGGDQHAEPVKIAV